MDWIVYLKYSCHIRNQYQADDFQEIKDLKFNNKQYGVKKLASNLPVTKFTEGILCVRITLQSIFLQPITILSLDWCHVFQPIMLGAKITFCVQEETF